MRVVTYVTDVTYNLICVQRATMLQETLRGILDLDELKKDTVTTRSVLASAKRLIGLKNETEQQHLALLVTKMSESYSDMLASVTRYKLHNTERSYGSCFTTFSCKDTKCVTVVIKC